MIRTYRINPQSFDLEPVLCSSIEDIKSIIFIPHSDFLNLFSFSKAELAAVYEELKKSTFDNFFIASADFDDTSGVVIPSEFQITRQQNTEEKIPMPKLYKMGDFRKPLAGNQI